MAIQVPQTQRQVQARAINPVQVSTTAPIEAFGGGQGVENVKNAFNKLVETTDTLVGTYDDIEANKAIAEATKKKNAYMFGDPDDPETEGGYYSKSGKNAMADIDKFKNKLKSSFDSIEGSLANDRQRAKFRKAALGLDVEVDGAMKRHALAEAQKYDNEETSASIKAYQDDAILNYKQNPSKIRESISKQDEAIISFAARQGFGPDSEFTKQKLVQAKTATHKGILERMLANDEDLYAVEYLKQAKELGELDGRAIADLERMVEAGSLRGESQRRVDSIMDRGLGLGKALEAAREIEDPKLRDEVTQRLKVRFSEEKAVEEEINKKNYEDLFDQLNEFKTLSKIPADRLAKLDSNEYKALKDWELKLNSSKMIVTDQEKFYNLRLMAATPQTRDKFAKMNLFVEARNYLSDKDFNKLVDLQAGLIKGDENVVNALDGYRTDSEVVNGALKAAGIDSKKDPDVANQFRSVIDEKVEKWKQENGGKSIPNSELQKIVDYQLVQGVVPGTGFMGAFKTKKRLFQVEQDEQIEVDVETLPKSEVQKIKQALNKKGLPVTDENILNLYMQVNERKR